MAAGEAAEFDTKNPHWFGSNESGPVERLSMSASGENGFT
jgi:hypothetical protein